MKLNDQKFPVEPLPESSWRRVEAAVFAELERREHGPTPTQRATHRRWPMVAGASVVLLQVAAAVLFLVLRKDASDHNGVGSTQLVAHERAIDAMLDDIAIHVEPDSALVAVGNSDSGRLVVIERGAMRFSVAPRGKRPPFVVQAGEVRVQVVGTQFRVERRGDTARVDTFEGVVRVVAAGRTVLVRRGETWPAGSPPLDASAASASPTAAESKRDAGLASPPVPTPGVSPGDAGVVSKAHDKASRVPSGHRHARAASAPDVEVHPASGEREVFQRAAKLEATDPQEALRLYRSLAARTNGWGANALYALGRLELELGNRANALHALQDYVQRYPEGPNASDALKLIDESSAKRATTSHAPGDAR